MLGKDATARKLEVRARWVGARGDHCEFTLPIKQVILLCAYSCNKYLLSVYYVPGSMLGAGIQMRSNHTKTCP